MKLAIVVFTLACALFLAGCPRLDLPDLPLPSPPVLSNQSVPPAANQTVVPNGTAPGANQTTLPNQTVQPVPPEEDWNESQVKLTWVGSQRKIIPSSGFAAGNYAPAKFADRNPALDYSNDEIALVAVVLTEPEMKRLVERAQSLDFVSNPQFPAAPALSYMHYDGTTGAVNEAVLDEQQASELSDALAAELTGHEDALAVLRAYG